ncbi:MAG: hypothetical protein RR572_07280, partial [Raoultibacter sp.]
SFFSSYILCTRNPFSSHGDLRQIALAPNLMGTLYPPPRKVVSHKTWVFFILPVQSGDQNSQSAK